jgi:hypothetical protein
MRTSRRSAALRVAARLLSRPGCWGGAGDGHGARGAGHRLRSHDAPRSSPSSGVRSNGAPGTGAGGDDRKLGPGDRRSGDA